MTTPLIVMGVSGVGKSSLARALADRLGYRFIEGDDCHPPANIAKMAAGTALQDDDRRPFLENVAAAINAVSHGRAVASCSALKRSYRDLLRARCPGVIFIFPELDRVQLLQRMRDRAHFMPTTLLDSQLETLERPGFDERAIVIDGDQSPAILLAELIALLEQSGIIPAGSYQTSH